MRPNEEDCPMPDLRVLGARESPSDPDNNIVLTEVTRSRGLQEYTLTVTIDGKALSTAGPFQDREEAVEQASAEASHYALEPIYVRQEID
jgi:hypothetical protein